MKNRVYICSFLLFFSYLPFGVTATPQPIVIVENNWSSQVVLSRILGAILRKMDFQVAYRPTDTDLQFEALGLGLVHVQLEVWEGTMKVDFERELIKGSILDLGNHSAFAREDWWYPNYVQELCPGLPDWKALNACAHLFATQETAPSGRFLAGPWEKNDQPRVYALGLNYAINTVDQAETLWAELAVAAKQQQPILMYNWTPNAIEHRYPGTFIEFPEYHELCATDEKWGDNINAIYDCGNPKSAWIKKVAWKGMEERWPCAISVIREFDFTNEMLSEVAALIDFQGYTRIEAANIWLEKNHKLWNNWIPTECKIK